MKRNKNSNTILKTNPCRRRTLMALGVHDGKLTAGKLPKSFTYDGELYLFDWRGNNLGAFHIIVKAWEPSIEEDHHGTPHEVKSSKHRIFAKFGDRLIPVGRLAQAVL